MNFEKLDLVFKKVDKNRDPNYNWKEGFVSFREFLKLANESGVGVFPEIKHGAATNRVIQF